MFLFDTLCYREHALSKRTKKRKQRNLLSSNNDSVLGHESLGLDSSVISGGLRTIRTVLTAPSSLYGEESTLLHFPEVMNMSMDASLKPPKPPHDIITRVKYKEQ